MANLIDPTMENRTGKITLNIKTDITKKMIALCVHIHVKLHNMHSCSRKYLFKRSLNGGSQA